MLSTFDLGWERATDSYKIWLFVAKLSSAGPCKLTCPDVYNRTITDSSEICLQEAIVTSSQNQELCKVFRLVYHSLSKTYKSLSKRCPFTLQKGVFHTSKEHLLPCERVSFAVSKSICYFQFMNIYYNPSYALVPFITREYLSLCIIITTP